MKKGSRVTIKDEFSDRPGNEFEYILIENPCGGRVKIQSTNSGLSLPPVEVVRTNWIKII